MKYILEKIKEFFAPVDLYANMTEEEKERHFSMPISRNKRHLRRRKNPRITPSLRKCRRRY